MIKFPTTISEYTDGKLWRQGVDESIARRILVDLHKIEDENELDLRKMYLAQFYCKIGDYRIAATLAKGFLLENKFVDDSIELLKKICLFDRDIENFASLVKLVEVIYRGKTPLSFYADEEYSDILMSFNEGKDTGKGKIAYNAGAAEYYQNGKLIFSVEDKNYNAFFKDSAARFFLSENRPESALEILSTINLSQLRLDIRIFCHQTYVRALCMLEDYQEAYNYSVLLMENDVYISNMTELFFYLYETQPKGKKFIKMKEYLMGYKYFESTQLSDMHSLAKDIKDDNFWIKIYENNPIDPADISEETYLFKGILAFNAQDYDLANENFNKAKAIYGRFGKAQLFKYYSDSYQRQLKNDAPAENMSGELYTAHIDEVYSFIDKKLFLKLKKCLSAEDFKKNFEDNLLELDNMLSGVTVKIADIVNIIKRVYRMGVMSACEFIKKVIVDSDYNVFIRAICLAVFMMYSKQKKFILGKNIYVNPFVKELKFDFDGEIQNFSFGAAIFLALSILDGIDAASLKKECKFLNKIYTKVTGDYSHVTPLSVFGVLGAYFSGEEIHYDKLVVKKREVKEFAHTFAINEAFLEDGDNAFADEDIFDFFRFCIGLC